MSCSSWAYSNDPRNIFLWNNVIVTFYFICNIFLIFFYEHSHFCCIDVINILKDPFLLNYYLFISMRTWFLYNSFHRESSSIRIFSLKSKFIALFCKFSDSAVFTIIRCAFCQIKEVRPSSLCRDFTLWEGCWSVGIRCRECSCILLYYKKNE